jgi:4-oxalocrotonate tautomerase
MPLIRIDLPRGKSPEYRAAVVESVYLALTSAAGAPATDKFMIVSEHAPSDIVMDPHFIVERSSDALIVQITLNEGRTVETKRNLYRAIADNLHDSVGLRTEDVVISLVEVAKANWSFGLGEAQYAPATELES